jgi:hypothetical protein
MRGGGMPAGPRRPAAARGWVFVWASNLIACLYVLWLCGRPWYDSRDFDALAEGLGTELPWTTRLVARHGSWIFPTLCAGFVLAVLGKEWMVKDKRYSLLLTFLLVLIAQLVAQAGLLAYHFPLFDLLRRPGAGP